MDEVSYAEMNNLQKFDRHQELGLIEVFAGALDKAFGEYQNHPFGSPTIPDWRRIEVALDGILPEPVKLVKVIRPLMARA